MNNEELQKLILENQIVIMDFLLYPNAPEGIIKQRNKTEEALTPKVNDLRKRNEKSLNKFSSKGENK